MGRTIFALFDDALAAIGVASAFEREGHDRSVITLIVPDPRGRYTQRSDGDGKRLRVFEALQAPGLGPAAVTGPLTSDVLAGARERGGLAEALVAIGFEQPSARHFFESMRRGQAILGIGVPAERVDQTTARLRKMGARAIEDVGKGAAPAPAARSAVEDVARPPQPEPVVNKTESVAQPVAPRALEAERLTDRITVPVVEEQLEVAKRQVQRGGVRIHSHVVEQPVEESVSLREERLHVERRQVYRDATEEDLADFREGTIEFHESVEEAVITKRRRVVEEIVIGKETRERTERISETLRKTEVQVEQLDGGALA